MTKRTVYDCDRCKRTILPDWVHTIDLEMRGPKPGDYKCPEGEGLKDLCMDCFNALKKWMGGALVGESRSVPPNICHEGHQ